VKPLSAAVLLLALCACHRPDRGPGGSSAASPAGAPAPHDPKPPVVQVFPLVLGPGSPHRLAKGAVDAWEIDLADDTYLHATFEQKGLDVTVDVFAPGHRRLFHVDSPTETQGPEEVRLVAAGAGRYRLEVSAPAGTGAYIPLLRRIGRPTEKERGQAAADRLYYEAREIDRQPGRFWEAAAKYEEAIRRFEEVGDRRHRAYAFYRLARLAGIHGRTAQARELFRRSESLFAELGDRHFLTLARNEIGQCAMEQGDFDSASAAFQGALALAREDGAVREEASVRHNLGKLLQDHGRPWEALASFRTALGLWRRLDGDPARANEAVTLTGVGWVYASLGQWPRAIEAHRQALRVRNRLGDPQQRAAAAAVSLTQLGAVWLRLEPRRALPYFEKAWSLQKDGASRGDQASTLNGLGRAYSQLGRFDEAWAAYRKALDLYGALSDLGGQSITWTNLGWTSISRGRPEQAAASFEQGLRLARQTHNPMAEARARLGLAAAERDRGNPTAAEAHAEAALDLVESLRGAVTRPDLQSTYLAANENVYSVLIRILMERHRRQPGDGYDLQALARSEQARARVLLDALRDSRELRSEMAAGVSPDLLAQRRRLLAEVSALDVQRHRLDATPDEAAGAEVKLADRLDRLQELAAEIHRRRLPAQSLPRLSPSLTEQRRRLLDGDTLLLEYAFGSPHSTLWLVSPDAVQSFELPGREALEPLLRAAEARLARHPDATGPPAGDDPLSALSRLSQALLGPVARQIAGKRLLIAADGAQQALPFAVLPDPAHPGEPLLVRHEVVSIPSLAVLAELRDREESRPPAPFPLALLADPVFDASDGRLPPGRPSAAPEPREPQDLFLPRLPQSRREAAAIAALLPPGEAFVALDTAASRELVTSGRLSRFRTLHIATHGLLRQDHPELSALVLSRFDKEGRPRDGYLRVPDVEALSLPADLVVLSACETALGRETAGEGMEGLPQAFFTAGASRVLVSLWQVEEASTEALMETFYRRLLRDHQPAAKALREAQLAVRAQPQWSDPRFWAGFVLEGDWR
jgi:CHAT domain-containing protein/tetratricopeptide (TPR) repeat protein